MKKNPFLKYEKIIIEENDFFNIYIELYNNQKITVEQIEKILLKIEGSCYQPHQIVDGWNLTDCYLLQRLKYPFLSDLLVVIRQMIKSTTSTDSKSLREYLIKNYHSSIYENKEISNSIINTVKYFNSKKNILEN
jgi:hypothetical protein